MRQVNLSRLKQLQAYAASEQHKQMITYAHLRAEKVKLQDNIFTNFGSDFANLVLNYPTISQDYSEKYNLQSQVNAISQQLFNLQAEYDKLVKGKTNNEVLSKFYKAALEDLTSQYLDRLSFTLSDVYQSVYNRTDKQVKLSIEDYRGKKVIRLKIINEYEGGTYDELLEQDGGSAMIILGSIVAIYFILVTDAPRIIMFDEAVSALANDTLIRYLEVLKRFVSELDFTFVIVEHAAYRLKGYVNQLFTVKNGVYEEIPQEQIDGFLERSGSKQ